MALHRSRFVDWWTALVEAEKQALKAGEYPNHTDQSLFVSRCTDRTHQERILPEPTLAQTSKITQSHIRTCVTPFL